MAAPSQIISDSPVNPSATAARVHPARHACQDRLRRLGALRTAELSASPLLSGGWASRTASPSQRKWLPAETPAPTKAAPASEDTTALMLQAAWQPLRIG